MQWNAHVVGWDALIEFVLNRGSITTIVVTNVPLNGAVLHLLVVTFFS